MGRWKLSLGALIVVLIIVISVISLNNKSANKVPVNTNQTSSTSTLDKYQIVDPNAAKFEGQENLTKYEGIAQKNSSSPTDQVNAAESAFVNKDYNKAVEYYKKAVVLQPKNVQYLTYLGNAYYRGLDNPQEAIKYYQTATQLNPRYANGWWNLALCEKDALGNTDAAKETLKKGIASVDPKDPLLKTLQTELDALK
ncbi:MAG: tetratricopeptide repeat protein [Desulfosporosinus sp.]|nr:tetratricopeptide repeat protein [Desulfosporosinus sp.]